MLSFPGKCKSAITLNTRRPHDRGLICAGENFIPIAYREIQQLKCKASTRTYYRRWHLWWIATRRPAPRNSKTSKIL